MNRTSLFIALALTFAAGPAFASSASAVPAPQTFVAVADAGATTTATRGAYVAFAQPYSAGTGYGWEVAGVKPAGALTALGGSSIPAGATTSGGHPILGGGRTALLLFRAAAPGRATVTLVLRRPWEKNVKPAQSAVFHVVIR